MIVRNKIYLSKRRDFGDLFNTMFALVRRNFGVLFGAFFLAAGVPVIAVAVVYSYLQSGVLHQITNLQSRFFVMSDPTQFVSDLISNNFGWLLLMMVLGLLSFSFVRTTVASFLVIYNGKNEGDDFTIGEVIKKTYRDVWIVFAGTIINAILMTIVFGIILSPLILLSAYGGAGGIGFSIFIVILLMLAFYPQLVYIFQFAPPFVMVRDGVFIFTAIGRTFKNLKGNFWWTWVLMVCTLIICGIVGFFGNIPTWIYSGFSSFSRTSPEEALSMYSSPIYIATYSFALFWNNLSTIFADLMTGVSYYSFEEERTGQALNRMIDSIGQPEENPNYTY